VVAATFYAIFHSATADSLGQQRLPILQEFSVITTWCLQFWFYQSFSRLISVFGYRFRCWFYQSFSRLISVFGFGSTSLFQDLSVFSVIGLGVGSTSLSQD
jgi:hypothetical protein